MTLTDQEEEELNETIAYLNGLDKNISEDEYIIDLVEQFNKVYLKKNEKI